MEHEKMTQILFLVVFMLVMIYVVQMLTAHGFESLFKATLYSLAIIGFIKYIFSGSDLASVLMIGKLTLNPIDKVPLVNQQTPINKPPPAYNMDSYAFSRPSTNCLNKFDSDLRSLAYMQNMNERAKENSINQFNSGRSLGPFYDDLMAGNDDRDWWENY